MTCNPPPSIEPSDTDPCYTRSVWPPQLNLVVQSSTTPGQFDPHPQWNLMAQSPTSPGQSDALNQTTCYRALPHHVSLTCGTLHQVSLTCGRMQMYPGQVYPHPPLIKLSGTEPYYTRVSLPCGRMQIYPGQMYPPKLNLVVQSTTTPGQFDMWKNADIPRSDVHPLLIKPSGTEPYYTRSNDCKISDETYTPC